MAGRVIVKGSFTNVSASARFTSALTASIASSPIADTKGRYYAVAGGEILSQPVQGTFDTATKTWTVAVVPVEGVVYRISAPGFMPDCYVDSVAYLPMPANADVEVDADTLIGPPGGDTQVEYVTLTTIITSIDLKVASAVENYLTAHPPAVAVNGTVAISGKQILDVTQNYGPGTGWTSSSTTTGGPSTDSTYAAYTATRPVPVTPGATYTAQRVGGVIFFDAAGNRATWHPASPLSPITVTAPATAVSVAVNYPTADAALVQLEAGPTASPVEPFYITIPNLAGPGGTPYLPPDKRAPLALSLAGSVSTITAATQHVRMPFKAPAPIKRARLHLRNYNDLFGLTYPGAVTLTGVHIGVHAIAAAGDLTGNFTAAPKQVIASATTPSDGAEYVSDWFTLPTHSTGDDLLLSYGFTTDGTTTIHRGIGGCWTSTAHTEAAQPTPATAMTAGYQPPLDVWLECEVDGRVAVVLYLGDSLTAGYGAQWPIYDSWATRHALANGAWPWVNGHTGSSLYQWSSTLAYWRWAKHNGMSAPDAAIIAGGSNDIAYGRTDMQTTLATVAGNIRAKGTRRIHLATVMPRNFDATKETARTDYNAWLRTLPLGAVQTWDFSRAVESAPGAATLDSAVDFDGTHLNRGGYARMAAVVTGTLAAWPGA